MSYDLLLGFKEPPKDLDNILSQLGFKPSASQSRFYTFYQEGKSLCPLEFVYVNEIDDPEFWQSVDFPVISEATISARGDTKNPDNFDCQKQREFAKYLRDHYKALLIDPQQFDKRKVIIRD